MKADGRRGEAPDPPSIDRVGRSRADRGDKKKDDIKIACILRNPEDHSVEAPPGMRGGLLRGRPELSSIRAAIEEGIPVAQLFRFKEHASAYEVQHRRWEHRWG